MCWCLGPAAPFGHVKFRVSINDASGGQQDFEAVGEVSWGTPPNPQEVRPCGGTSRTGHVTLLSARLTALTSQAPRSWHPPPLQSTKPDEPQHGIHSLTRTTETPRGNAGRSPPPGPRRRSPGGWAGPVGGRGPGARALHGGGRGWAGARACSLRTGRPPTLQPFGG